MDRVLLLENPVQHYAWGSHEWIPQMLGVGVSLQPWAELWMGAHSKAPSRAEGRSLDTLIARDPAGMLGAEVVARHGPRLPFLVKLLAARIPLSLQTHPNRAQAQAGFAREEATGVPRQAPQRNYRDDNHKPELLVALRPFWGLNGFRPVPEALDTLQQVGLQSLASEVTHLVDQPNERGLARFFEALMTRSGVRRRGVAMELVSRVRAMEDSRPEFAWILRAHQVFGPDVGLVAFLLLNLVRLEPGQAMACRAGDLHAYLEGFGVEVMANSDNVLRGGCTSKHMDVPELLQVLNYHAAPAVVLEPTPCGRGEVCFPSIADDFDLRLVSLASAERWQPRERRGVELLLCVEGRVALSAGPQRVDLLPGAAALVPAGVQDIVLVGPGRVFRVQVGPG